MTCRKKNIDCYMKTECRELQGYNHYKMCRKCLILIVVIKGIIFFFLYRNNSLKFFLLIIKHYTNIFSLKAF